MILTGIEDGSWTSVSSADFAEGAQEISFKVRGNGTGKVSVLLDSLDSEAVSVVDVAAPGADLSEVTASFKEKVSGVHNVYFVFEGSDFEVYSWIVK